MHETIRKHPNIDVHVNILLVALKRGKGRVIRVKVLQIVGFYPSIIFKSNER